MAIVISHYFDISVGRYWRDLGHITYNQIYIMNHDILQSKIVK